MNYYEILEVSPNASAEVIRAAYKSLMQRYHPDKTPENSAMAERASLVVQAYEILSQADRRAAYDLAQKDLAKAPRRANRRENRSEIHRGNRQTNVKTAATDNKLFWSLCLILGAIILLGWTANALMKRSVLPGPDLSSRSVKVQRDIPVLLERITINLHKPDNPSEDSGRVLFIPLLGVRVGPQDAENAIRHLNNTRDLVAQKVQEKLVDASFSELIKADGEQYLEKLILDAISETRAAGSSDNAPLFDPDAPDRYGVVEVLLPESYSIK